MQKNAEQLEIFSGNNFRAGNRTSFTDGFLTKIFTFEKKIILFFCFLIVGLISFSIGIERGKRIARHALSHGQNLATPQEAVPTAKPAIPPIKPAGIPAAVSTQPKVMVKTTVAKKTVAPVQVKPTVAPSTQKSIAKKAPVATQKNTGIEKKSPAAKVKTPQQAPAVSALMQPAGFFTIQVASFKDNKFALTEVETLKKKGIAATIFSKGDFSIVCVGSYPTKEVALAQLPALQKRYPNCIIRRM